MCVLATVSHVTYGLFPSPAFSFPSSPDLSLVPVVLPPPEGSVGGTLQHAAFWVRLASLGRRHWVLSQVAGCIRSLSLCGGVTGGVGLDPLLGLSPGEWRQGC